VTPALLVLHAAATLMLAGLIWYVQIAHYPLMASVGRDGFAAYERQHQRRTTLVVGPLMLVEAIGSVAILAVPATPGGRWLAVAGVILLAVIWLSTWLLQVPCHRRLERGWEPATLRRLVATNWVRTGAWSARGVIGLVILVRGDAP
jgi:hypothetical protein